MSRIGKMPIALPEGVKASVKDDTVNIEGPKGKLTQRIPDGISVKVEEGQVVVERASDERQHRALHGLIRSLLANHVHGVSQGYEKALDIVGVGYRAELVGKNVHLQLGFSHGIEVQPQEGIEFEVGQDRANRQFFIIVRGIDKQLVGQTAANIRAMRKPEPYKGKGVRYRGEVVRRKVGKSAVGAGF